MRPRAVLAVDEGTTGTRAGLVAEDGTVGQVFSQPVDVYHPSPQVVEQDAHQIWCRTHEAVQHCLSSAARAGVEVVGLALSAQRATAVLWDADTGLPLVPAVVWQDRRHADQLAVLGQRWSDDLLRRTGRAAGSRSPFLWVAAWLQHDADVQAAHRGGRLRFGTVDAYLLWKLTGGSVHATSATQACAAGGYLLREHAWHSEWVEFLGCPSELLPDLYDDDGDFGVTDATVLGHELPIRASVGDQHAARIALGCAEPDVGVCVHGTGSFVGTSTADLIVEPDPKSPGVIPLLGWRASGVSNFGVEAYCPTTGAALRWLCEELRLFASPAQISDLAQHGSDDDLMFLPALAGLRTPRWEPAARGRLVGLDLATRREDIARAVLAGIAHSVCDADDGIAAVTGTRPRRWRFAGGLAASEPLLRIQADLLGVPIERRRNGATASLRGAAYLAGSRLGLWTDPSRADSDLEQVELLEPRIGQQERQRLRERWLTHAIPHP